MKVVARKYAQLPFSFEHNNNILKYSVGDIIRTYDISGDVLNIKDAKQIFLSIKSNAMSFKNLTLEVWDVEQPRASYYHTTKDVRLVRVF